VKGGLQTAFLGKALVQKEGHKGRPKRVRGTPTSFSEGSLEGTNALGASSQNALDNRRRRKRDLHKSCGCGETGKERVTPANRCVSGGTMILINRREKKNTSATSRVQTKKSGGGGHLEIDFRVL